MLTDDINFLTTQLFLNKRKESIELLRKDVGNIFYYILYIL